MQSVYLQRITKKNAVKGYEKTNPKQTQFPKRPKMNANLFTKKDYENFIPLAGYKNKPNQSQSFAPLFRVIYTLRGASKFHPLMVKTGSSFVAANTASMFLLSPGSKLM